MLNTVFTHDVRQTLDHFRRSVDQLFENFYGFNAPRTAEASRSEGADYTFSPVLESGWTENHLDIRAILPGVPAEDVNVSIRNNQLVIEGERKAPEGFTKHAYTQLVYGKFYTAVTMPSGLDLDKLVARLHDGVLDIQIPVSEAVKPRQVPIQTGEQRKAIGA
jgi:HSP20 family protein